MLMSRTPLRMSFVGGGSDLPAFYNQTPGAVISTTIDKYVYICLSKKFDNKIRLGYSKTEIVDSVSQIEHSLFRHALELTNLGEAIELVSIADIPSTGSGLGSSSAFSVGLLQLLHAYKGIRKSAGELAELACHLEIDKGGATIGKQDQYAAAYGGLKRYNFLPNGQVNVKPVVCSQNFLKVLNDSCLVFFTGQTRSAGDVLRDQSSKMSDNKKFSTMQKMVELVDELEAAITCEDFSAFGRLLNDNWELKRSISGKIANKKIDSMYERGLKSGALGGKLMGAGNGGFMLFFAPKIMHKKIISELSEFRLLNVNFENMGSSIIYQDN